MPLRLLFLLTLPACQPPSPADTAPTHPAGDSDPPAEDTGEPDTDDSAPQRLPYAGSFTLDLAGRRCEGAAEAVVIGAVNVAGNASCRFDDGESLDVTISGRVQDAALASGDVAAPGWTVPWQGAWSAGSLDGSFAAEAPTDLSGAFSMTAER